MTAAFDRDLYMRAWHYAASKHNGQLVPGSALPYVVHLGAVAMEVIGTLAIEEFDAPNLAVGCALLHDTLEDTSVSADEIASEFGQSIAEGVLALTKFKSEKGNAMADSLRRIKLQPREVWLVKLADRTVNMEPPPSHWTLEKRRKYQRQAIEIVEELGAASPSLAARLRDKIVRYPVPSGD
ncbi:MAG: HD domain-containing protein [Polyangiaceae bacterium]